DHFGIMLLGQLHAVANMVAMAMRAQHDVELVELFLVRRSHGIIHDPGIDEDVFAGRSFNKESGMTEPGELDAFQVHDFSSFSKSGNFKSERRCWLLATGCWLLN